MSGLRCPVCGVEKNSYGEAFSSEWAVSCHVAGKIFSGDKLHKAWGLYKVHGLNINVSVPKLAEALMWFVHQDLEADRSLKPSIPSTPLSIIHDIEVKLHGYVKHRLKDHFGGQDDSWWVNGIPLSIRQECAQLREADKARIEPYAYIYLIDLKSILEKNWLLFESDFLKVRTIAKSKKEFLTYLLRLNEIRNSHSHPIRKPEIDSKAYKEDLEFAQRLKDLMDDFCET